MHDAQLVGRAGEGVAGGDTPDQLTLSVAQQEVGPAVVGRFPFLSGCTALQLPPDVASAPDKVRNRNHILVCTGCVTPAYAFLMLILV